MQSTVFNMQFTGFRSPPRPPSRRLPSVASGENHYDDDFSLWAGSTLTTPVFGPNSGVHHRDGSPGETERKLLEHKKQIQAWLKPADG